MSGYQEGTLKETDLEPFFFLKLCTSFPVKVRIICFNQWQHSFYTSCLKAFIFKKIQDFYVWYSSYFSSVFAFLILSYVECLRELRNCDQSLTFFFLQRNRITVNIKQNLLFYVLFCSSNIFLIWKCSCFWTKNNKTQRT